MHAFERPRSARLGFWLLIGLLATFAGGKAILFDTLDPDCFWHLCVAAQLHRDGIGPIVDDLSFASSKQPWTPYSWLAEMGMKALWDFGGYRAAVGFAAVMQGSIVVLLAMCCVEIQQLGGSSFFQSSTLNVQRSKFEFNRTSNIERPTFNVEQNHPDPSPLPEYRERDSERRYFAAAIATAIGTFLILPYLSFRPVTMGFVLLFAIAWLVLRDQRLAFSPSSGTWGEGEFERKAGSVIRNHPHLNPLPEYREWGPDLAIWATVPLTVLLTNIHLFSFFVPAMMLGMAMGAMFESSARRAARYCIMASATCMACLATPMLPGLIKTVFYYSAQDKMVTGPVIAEMQSIVRGPMGWIAAAGVISMVACIAAGYRRLAMGQLICVAVAALLMLKLGRFAPLFALAACPALAATLPGVKDRLLAKPLVVALLAVVLMLIGIKVIAAFPGRSVTLAAWVNRHGADTPGYPCAAADFLDRSVPHPTGHLINEFSWGGYLAWRLDGKYQVLLDGRTQVYPQSVWQSTYLGSDRERQNFLAGIPADAALVPVGKSKFRDDLLRMGWTRAYQDDRAMVLLPPGAVARIE